MSLSWAVVSHRQLEVGDRASDAKEQAAHTRGVKGFGPERRPTPRASHTVECKELEGEMGQAEGKGDNAGYEDGSAPVSTNERVR